jgi:hypothetical protein
MSVIRIIERRGTIDVSETIARIVRVYDYNLPAGMLESIFTAAGQLIGSSAANSPVVIPAPTIEGQFLVGRLAEGGRMKWESVSFPQLVQTEVKTGAYTAAANDHVLVDTSGGNIAITLPPSPANGVKVRVTMVRSNGIVSIDRNGSLVNGLESAAIFDLINKGDTVYFEYTGALLGWLATLGARFLRYITKGYILGGYTTDRVAVIEDLIFATETSQAISATLDTAKSQGTGVNSSTKGYILGGYIGSAVAVIEDLVFATETSVAISATLDTAKYNGAGVNSSTKGYVLGGNTGAATAVIEDLIFATETSQAISATLDTAKYGGAGVNSSTKGYVMGGWTGAVTAVIEDLIFATETSVAISATLDTAKRAGVGVNSSTKGYIMGGFTTVQVTVIEDLIFATETSQAISATLDTAKDGGAGVNRSTKGYVMGGWTTAPIAVIEDLVFATETSAAITATLDTAKYLSAGLQNGYV